ncbi:MAG TPA: glycosyltransferase family 4 protein [Planctomycetaceae bacterium]|nr:glycosyltransferase family 4 protein [Planctomycetaceae bacterium]
MRIAVVRRECSLKKAGAERYCVNLFRQLQKLGHEVTIVGEAIDEELRQEVAYLPVPVNHTTSWTKNESFAVNAAVVVGRGKFDIVHGLSRVDGLDTYRLTDPLQTHWVNVYYRQPWNRWLQSWNPRHRAIFAIEKRLFGNNGPRRIIVQSQLDGRLLRDYFGVPEERLRRVCNGVDTNLFQPGDGSDRALVREELGLAAEQPLLIFASMDFRRKGLGSLFAAMRQMKYRDAALAVLGNGDIRRYEQIAKQQGVEKRVHFLGRQSAMSRFYRAGDVFVLPTIYEPFPNVNLEAMACGIPVVTTATAGGADIVQDGVNGYVVPDAWSIPDLADRIDALLALSTGQRGEISTACRATALQFPVERNARETVAVLEEAWREKFRV